MFGAVIAAGREYDGDEGQMSARIELETECHRLRVIAPKLSVLRTWKVRQLRLAIEALLRAERRRAQLKNRRLEDVVRDHTSLNTCKIKEVENTPVKITLPVVFDRPKPNAESVRRSAKAAAAMQVHKKIFGVMISAHADGEWLTLAVLIRRAEPALDGLSSAGVYKRLARACEAVMPESGVAKKRGAYRCVLMQLVLPGEKPPAGSRVKAWI